jgi:hypothetical protein
MPATRNNILTSLYFNQKRSKLLQVHLLAETDKKNLADLQGWSPQTTTAAKNLGHQFVPVIDRWYKFIETFLPTDIYRSTILQDLPGSVSLYFLLPGINFFLNSDLFAAEKLPGINTGLSTFSHISPIDSHDPSFSAFQFQIFRAWL